jgi:hypothetical protein
MNAEQLQNLTEQVEAIRALIFAAKDGVEPTAARREMNKAAGHLQRALAEAAIYATELALEAAADAAAGELPGCDESTGESEEDEDEPCEDQESDEEEADD